MNEHKLTHGEALLDSVDLLLGDPSYNARSRRENVCSSFDDSTFEGMADATALGKQVVRSGPHDHL